MAVNLELVVALLLKLPVVTVVERYFSPVGLLNSSTNSPISHVVLFVVEVLELFVLPLLFVLLDVLELEFDEELLEEELEVVGLSVEVSSSKKAQEDRERIHVKTRIIDRNVTIVFFI